MRILIVRLSALGDIVMASGLIPALRARWPDAHIAWLAEPAGAVLLEANPRVDEVIRWDRLAWKALARGGRWLALGRAVAGLRSRLRAGQYDLVLDTQGLLKSALPAWLSAAPRRVGLASREGGHRLMTEVVQRPGDGRRLGSEYRQLAAHLGCPDTPYGPDLALSAADQADASRALAAAGVNGAYAALCPFTTRAQKHWFEDRWIALGRALAERHGLLPVVLGGPDDRSAADTLASGMGAGAVTVAGRLGLRASAAAVADARLVVGVDTALTHMGTAFHRPTVALFGSTRPYLETDSPGTRVLYEPLWCSPCRRRPICGGVFSCMRLHRPGGVLDAAARAMEDAA